MQTITFPGLNLEFHISKIAIQIGKISIHWYAIFIVLAFIIALYLCKRKNGLYNVKFENILDLFLILIPVSIICARLYYCLFKLDVYMKNPIKILDITTGGLAIYGGIIGGVITCYIYCKKKKIDTLNLLDYIVPFLSLGQAIGRLGNFVNVEAYGIQTKLPWRMGIIENNQYIEVHPTFIYEAIVTLILFFFLIKLQNKRKIKGEVTYTYLIVYSLSRAIIESLRSDSLMLYKFKISQILSIAIFVVFCIILCFKKIKYKKTKIHDKNCQKITYEM